MISPSPQVSDPAPVGAAPAGRAFWPRDTSRVVTDTTIAGILREAARSAPDRIALVAGVADPSARVRRTYAEVVTESEAVARWLAGRCEPGQRVAVVAPSIPESYLLSFAVAMARLVLVPVNPALRPVEIEHILGRSGAVLALSVDEYLGADVHDVVVAAGAAVDTFGEVVRFADWPLLVEAGRAATHLTLPPPESDDVAQLVFTSGTTGAPKGAMLTHRGMTNAARFSGERFDVRPGDVYVSTIPLFHVGGQVVTFMAVQAAATDVLLTAFDAGLLLDLVDTEYGTHTAGVPTMFHDVIAHPEFGARDLSSLRAMSTGGAPVPAEMVRHLEATLGVDVTIIFGQTETCGYISQTFLDDDAEDKAVTVGRLFPHLEGRVVDPATGEVVVFSEEGELEVRGPGTMVGFLDDPDQTTATLRPDGWLRTGDLATMDERGYLRVVGRLKDVIISGGVNVYPAEVEAALAEHPEVLAAAVVGRPHDRWGEQVVALVRLAPGAQVDEAALVEHARTRLAPHKVPKAWRFVDELPLTASGKVQKFLLVEQLAAEEPGS